jgi:hypothetical protein
MSKRYKRGKAEQACPCALHPAGIALGHKEQCSRLVRQGFPGFSEGFGTCLEMLPT